MIQQMLMVVNQDKFMLQRAIFHSDQETYEGSSYMALVTDKEKHNMIQQIQGSSYMTLVTRRFTLILPYTRTESTTSFP